ncbi:hypothetical protein FI667_g7993, partial [Globisporangium splendens]
MQQRQAPKTDSSMSTSPVSLGSEAHWILSTAGKWTEEDEKEWKREQHRENMVYFRLKKKEQRSQMKSQHRMLEAQLKQKLAIQRAAAARGARLAAAPWSANYSEYGAPSAATADKTFAMQPLQQSLTDLVTEREALRNENLSLEKRIAEYTKLQKLIHKEGELLSSDEEVDPRRPGESPLKKFTASAAGQQDKGSFVSLEGGSPSFYYEPISSDDCQQALSNYRQRFAADNARFTAGHMFGWKLERCLKKDAATGALFSRVWYTKRIHCPNGNAAALVDKLDADSWNVLVTPELFSRIHRTDYVSKTLQCVSDDAYIMIRNYFEPSFQINIRYLNLVTRCDEVNALGQRTVMQYLLIPDSNANRLAREADPRADVKWIVDGGAYMAIVQVDAETVEVVYDHFSYCMNQQQADFLMIDWGNIVVRWEQMVHPSRMLTQV